MKIHLIKKQTIEEYASSHSGSRNALNHWLNIIKYANWEKPADIQKTFGSADLLGKGSNRVVFDINGNKFRMICKYLFGESEVHLFVCWIGTHAEYTKLCVDNEQYEISNY